MVVDQVAPANYNWANFFVENPSYAHHNRRNTSIETESTTYLLLDAAHTRNAYTMASDRLNKPPMLFSRDQLAATFERCSSLRPILPAMESNAPGTIRVATPLKLSPKRKEANSTKNETEPTKSNNKPRQETKRRNDSNEPATFIILPLEIQQEILSHVFNDALVKDHHYNLVFGKLPWAIRCKNEERVYPCPRLLRTYEWYEKVFGERDMLASHIYDVARILSQVHPEWEIAMKYPIKCALGWLEKKAAL